MEAVTIARLTTANLISRKRHVKPRQPGIRTAQNFNDFSSWPKRFRSSTNSTLILTLPTYPEELTEKNICLNLHQL